MTQEEMKSVSYTSNVLKVSLMPVDSGLRDVIVQAAGGENTHRRTTFTIITLSY